MKTYDYIIGIDPGTNTGIAVWNCKTSNFEYVITSNIHTALFVVRDQNAYSNNLIRVEDARLRKWYGKDTRDRAKSQGVGSIKRDCSIWEDFLKDAGIDYEMVAPKAIKTKLTAKSFKNLTGWQGRTTEHSRDAGMLCWKHNG